MRHSHSNFPRQKQPTKQKWNEIRTVPHWCFLLSYLSRFIQFVSFSVFHASLFTRSVSFSLSWIPLSVHLCACHYYPSSCKNIFMRRRIIHNFTRLAHISNVNSQLQKRTNDSSSARKHTFWWLLYLKLFLLLLLIILLPCIPPQTYLLMHILTFKLKLILAHTIYSSALLHLNLSVCCCHCIVFTWFCFLFCFVSICRCAICLNWIHTICVAHSWLWKMSSLWFAT